MQTGVTAMREQTVSISGEKPIHWRRRRASQSLLPGAEFQSQVRSQSTGDLGVGFRCAEVLASFNLR